MNIYKPIYIVDIHQYVIGEKVMITGFVTQKYKARTHISVRIQDFTGSIIVCIDHAPNCKTPKWPNHYFWIGSRIRIMGSINLDNNNDFLINNVSDIIALGTVNPQNPNLGGEMKAQVSRMLMSRICNSTTLYLQENNFTQFESSVISNYWFDEGLEPLKVLYPGFGSPATLITSPAAQVMDFLTTTLAHRAFTDSISFTYTFRIPNGAAESRIIVAKAIDLDLDNHHKILWDISNKILNVLFDLKIDPSTQLPVPNILYGEWPDYIRDLEDNVQPFANQLNIVNYSANLSVIRESWKTRIDTIIHVVDKNRLILAEGSREVVGEEVVISSITIYPSRFLGLLEKAPERRLRNLWRFNDFNK